MEEFEKVQLLKQETQQAQKSTKSVVEVVYPELVLKKMEKFKIDDRFVILSPAVSRSVASKLTHDSYFNRRERDKRNLYLMKEGVIFPDTEAAKTLTTEELEHRTEQYANRKKLMATNPNLFISKTRLSIRGLHPGVTTNILKRAAIDSVNGFWTDVQLNLRDDLEPELLEEEAAQGFIAGPDRKIKIVQSKIISDQAKLDPVTKKCKSKGYGFVEFGSHADALRCLRYMNNNSKIFQKSISKESLDQKGEKKVKRPIVEFAVENRLILKKREGRKNFEQNADKEENVGDGEKNGKKLTKRKADGVEHGAVKRIKAKSTVKPNPDVEIKSAPTIKYPFKSGRDAKESRKPLNTKPSRSSGPRPLKHTSKSDAERTRDPKPEPSKPTKRKADNKDEEKFQNMVSAYKKKIVSGGETSTVQKSKWYS